MSKVCDHVCTCKAVSMGQKKILGKIHFLWRPSLASLVIARLVRPFRHYLCSTVPLPSQSDGPSGTRRKGVKTPAMCYRHYRCKNNLQKPSPSPDRHRTKSGGLGIEPRQYPSSTGSQYVVQCGRFPRAQHEPGILSSGSAKARPGLNFGPLRATGPGL